MIHEREGGRRENHGEEHERMFNSHATAMPNFAEYQERTSRKIPVIILEPLP